MEGLDFCYCFLLLWRFLFLLLLRFWWLLHLLWYLLCRYYCCSLHFRLLYGFWLLLCCYCWDCCHRGNRNILWRRLSVRSSCISRGRRPINEKIRWFWKSLHSWDRFQSAKSFIPCSDSTCRFWSPNSGCLIEALHYLHFSEICTL